MRPPDGSRDMRYPWGTVPTHDDKPRNPYAEAEFAFGHMYGRDERPMSSASTAPTYGPSLSRPASSAGLGQSRPVSRSRVRSALPRSHSAVRAADAPSYMTSGNTVRARPQSGVPRTERWQGLGNERHDMSEGARSRPATASSRSRPRPQSGYTHRGMQESMPPRIERVRSAPNIRAPRSAFSCVEVMKSPHVQAEAYLDQPVIPRLLPLKNTAGTMSLSGMKRELETLKANCTEIQDRQDSARGHMEVFRGDHLFVRQCEELKETLWPEIQAARAEITGMFEEMRLETYELQQQVDLLKHEKNSVAYILFRMDQKVKEIEEIIGHR